MKQSIYILCILFLTASSLQAQDKYGSAETRQQCMESLSFYTEFYKQKQFADAWPHWEKAVALCPNAKDDLFEHGRTMIHALIKEAKNKKLRKSCADKINFLYDNWMKRDRETRELQIMKAEDHILLRHSDNPNVKITTFETPVMEDEEPVFRIVETMPLFENANNPENSSVMMQEYFEKRILEDKVTEKGIVYAEFVVTKSGKVEHARIVKGVSPQLDKLALQYVSEMPDFTPGMQRGKNVYVITTIAVKFN